MTQTQYPAPAPTLTPTLDPNPNPNPNQNLTPNPNPKHNPNPNRVTTVCDVPVSHWVGWAQPQSMDQQCCLNLLLGNVIEDAPEPTSKSPTRSLA
jgi:hypothetical protein